MLRYLLFFLFLSLLSFNYLFVYFVMSTSNSLIDDLQIFVGGQNGSEKKLDEKMSQMMGDAYMHYANGSYDMVRYFVVY